MIRLGVLGSTKGTDLQAILDAIQNDALDAEVAVVISNRENAYILERARDHGYESCLMRRCASGHLPWTGRNGCSPDHPDDPHDTSILFF